MTQKIKITVMGTGTSTGVPVICCNCPVCQSEDPRDNRLRSAILVQSEDRAHPIDIVIDSGPDFRQQMLRAKVNDLTAIVYTHEHVDHIIGLDDVRPFNFFRKKNIPLYATQRVQDYIKTVFPYIFAKNQYPGIPQINFNLIDDEIFEIDGIKFTPIQVMHHRLPVLGFRINDFTYITDANFISEKEKDKIKGSKILILNALRKEAHISHFTLKQALDLVEELKPEQAYFTHISHQMGKYEDIQKELPKNVQIAYDGLTFWV